MLSCIGQDKKDAGDFFIKANSELVHGNYREAIRLYDEAIEKNNQFADAMLNKAICLIKENEVKEANDVLTKAIKIDPTLVQANLVRAETFLRLGDLAGAANDLATISTIYIDSSKFYLIRGNLYEAQSNSALSLADYEKATTLDTSNTEAWVNRGALHYQMQNFSEATKSFQRALKINPAQPEALNNLGLIAISQGQMKQAIKYFDVILNQNPSDPLALNNKGYAQLLLGNADVAGELISRSLEIAPDNAYALRNLGMYYERKKMGKQALEAYEKAIEIGTSVELLYGLAGNVYFLNKNSDKACQLWTKGKILKDSLAIIQWNRYCR